MFNYLMQFVALNVLNLGAYHKCDKNIASICNFANYNADDMLMT